LVQTVAMKFILKHGKTDKDIHNLRQEIEVRAPLLFFLPRLQIRVSTLVIQNNRTYFGVLPNRVHIYSNRSNSSVLANTTTEFC
jgi:hypothetical protein